MTTQQIIVYGSAADPARRGRPGDIDVAYTGDRNTAAAAVAEWAARHGLDGLPVDWHPATVSGNAVVLPAPYGQRSPYEVLSGAGRVDWRPEYGLSALIRAYGHDPRRLRKEVTREGAWWRLSVIPDPHAEREREREYIEGLTALRSAVAKRPAARDVLARQWPDVFPRLLDEDPRPGPQELKTLRNGSPWAGGDQVSIVLGRRGGVRLQYYRSADVVALLWPGDA